MAQRGGGSARPRVAVLTGFGRAFGGALIFGLPLLMTMELWDLGAGMDRSRLILLMAVSFPLLVGIAHRIGFEPTFDWREDVRDAMIALGVGVVACAGVLAVLGVLRPDGSPHALVGQVAIQSFPAAIGALLARSQLGGESPEDDDATALGGWAGTLFLMGVGAIFLSLTVAPTEEMVLLSFMMTPWHGLALVALSLMIMHGFVYALAFRRGRRREGEPGWSRFLRFTLTGYALCIVISVYLLWTFGRLDALGAGSAAMATIVLAFPAAIGAAAARLIL